MSLTTYIDDYLTDAGLEKFTRNTFLMEEILSEYGVDTEAEATDLTKLHKIARYFIWRKIVTSHSQDYDFSADGSSFKTSQMYEFAKEMMVDSFIDACPYLNSYEIKVEKEKFHHERHF